MSSTRQAVVRSDSLTPAGKRPDLTPSHHVDFETGNIAGIGGFVLGLPMIWESRMNPVSGRMYFVAMSLDIKPPIQYGLCPVRTVHVQYSQGGLIGKLAVICYCFYSSELYWHCFNSSSFFFNSLVRLCISIKLNRDCVTASKYLMFA